MQYLLQAAQDSIALARVRAEQFPPTQANLDEIHRLCATSEFNLRRALRQHEEDQESREAANSLLIQQPQTQLTT
jgi:uncharacterized protein involved in exopolysaccharide biosynthesis